MDDQHPQMVCNSYLQRYCSPCTLSIEKGHFTDRPTHEKGSTGLGFNHTSTHTSVFQVRRDHGSITVTPANKASRDSAIEIRQHGISGTITVSGHSNMTNLSEDEEVSLRSQADECTHVPCKAEAYVGETNTMRCTNSIHLLISSPWGSYLRSVDGLGRLYEP